jgi:hypothetical protein
MTLVELEDILSWLESDEGWEALDYEPTYPIVNALRKKFETEGE